MNGLKLKRLLHLWIGLCSVVGFAGGWFFFSHAAQGAATTAQAISSSPTAAVQAQTAATALPTLAPLTFNRSMNVIQPLTTNQNITVSSSPVLRTRGS